MTIMIIVEKGALKLNYIQMVWTFLKNPVLLATQSFSQAKHKISVL